MPDLPTTPPSPLPERLPDDERRVLVRTLLAQMGREKERQALLRFHVAGDGRDTLATDLGLAPRRIHRLLHRARSRYETLLQGRLAGGRKQEHPPVPGSGGGRDPEHAEIDEEALVERYHPGDLTPDERARFEAHFAACPRCRAALEVARDLHRTLRRVAVADVTEVALARAGVATWMARRGRYLGTVLAVLILAVVGAAAVWYGSRLRHQEEQLAEARAETAAQSRLLERERQRAAHLSAELGERRELWREEREALLDRLAAPRPTVDLSRVGDSYAVAVELGGGPAFPRYAVRVTGAGGEVEYRRDDLRPGDPELLVVSLPADLLPAGDHRLLVQGIGADGRRRDVATVAFRVAGGG